MKFLLAALALTAPMAALPAAPVAAPADDAERLVGLLLPEAQLLETIFTAVRKDFARVPEFRSDPAMGEFVLAKLRPDVEKVMRAELPSLRTELRAILAADMNPGEINDVYTFFASPTGQKLQRHLFKAMADHSNASPEEQKRIATEAFLADVTPGDSIALTRFGTSAGARKMNQVTPKISAASEGWASRLLVKHGPRFADLRAQAIADYKRQKGAGQ